MAFTKLALFLPLVCIAYSTLLPDQSLWELDSMERQLTLRNHLAVFDKDREPFVVMNMTVGVYGDNNPNQTYLRTFITDKLDLIQDFPVEPTRHNRVVQLQRGLPLKFNMTLFEIIEIGPDPVKKIGVTLQVLLYSDRRHHDQAMSMLKSMG